MNTHAQVWVKNGHRIGFSIKATTGYGSSSLCTCSCQGISFLGNFLNLLWKSVRPYSVDPVKVLHLSHKVFTGQIFTSDLVYIFKTSLKMTHYC